MYRHCVKRYITIGAIFPFDVFSPDNVTGKTKTEQQANFDVLLQETGWDRLKKMFQTNEFGGFSPEVHLIMYVTSMSAFIGALYGGINHSKTTYIDFIKNNQATAFKSHLDAKRKLTDKMMLSFGKGAFSFGWRLTLFTTSFVGIYTIIQTYRGKCGIIEYVIAGGISGCIYKFNLGPRGWIVGSGLGCALGLVCGGLTNLLLHISGLRIEDTRYWSKQLMEQRTSIHYKQMEEHRQKKENVLLYDHNKKYLPKEDVVKLNKEILEKLESAESEAKK